MTFGQFSSQCRTADRPAFRSPVPHPPRLLGLRRDDYREPIMRTLPTD